MLEPQMAVLVDALTIG